MRERNTTKDTCIVMGSELGILTQASFWMVLLGMPAHYLVPFSKANRVWEIIGYEIAKKTENVLIQ